MTQPGNGQGEPRMTDEEAPAGARVRRQATQTATARDQRRDAEREAQEREVTQDRELTEDERFELFVSDQDQAYLPASPPSPGYHVCWISTTNKRDSVALRLRMGYTLIKAEDLPGYEGASIKYGDHQGIVAVDEMLAAKIPLGLYNRMFRHVFDTLPRQEEEKLKVRTDMIKDTSERAGSRVVEVGDGTAHVVQRGARPLPEMTE